MSIELHEKAIGAIVVGVATFTLAPALPHQWLRMAAVAVGASLVAWAIVAVRGADR